MSRSPLVRDEPLFGFAVEDAAGRFDVSDVEWAIIEPLLPGSASQDRAGKGDREILNGIFFVLRTGTPWRDLPARYGTAGMVQREFRRWAQDGVWIRVFQALASRIEDPSEVHAPVYRSTR